MSSIQFDIKGCREELEGKKMGRMGEIKDGGLEREKPALVLTSLLCYFHSLLYTLRGRDRGKCGDSSHEPFVVES